MNMGPKDGGAYGRARPSAGSTNEPGDASGQGFPSPGSPHPIPESEHGFEVAISYLLRTGLIVSASIVLIGAALYLWESGLGHVDYRAFRSEPADLRAIGSIAHGARHLRSLAIMQFGLLLLIATPVARVLFSVFAFAKQRDRMYTVFTLIVLAILCYSLFSR